MACLSTSARHRAHASTGQRRQRDARAHGTRGAGGTGAAAGPATPIDVAAATGAERRALRAALADAGPTGVVRPAPAGSTQSGSPCPHRPHRPCSSADAWQRRVDAVVRGSVRGRRGPGRGCRRSRRRACQSEPVWLGDADAYELDAPASVTSVDVHLIGDGPEPRRLQLVPVDGGRRRRPEHPASIGLGSPRPDAAPATVTADLKLAIVHHSVSGNTYSAAQVPELLRPSRPTTRTSRATDDIAYNIVVDRFGRAWEGRAGGLTNVPSAGTARASTPGSVGVVVLGDYRSATPSAATIETVARVIAWKFALHRVDPGVDRALHQRRLGQVRRAGSPSPCPGSWATATCRRPSCPGGNLYSRLGAIRARVAQLVPVVPSGPRAARPRAGRDGDGLLDPLEYRPGPNGDAQWRASSTGVVDPHGDLHHRGVPPGGRRLRRQRAHRRHVACHRLGHRLPVVGRSDGHHQPAHHRSRFLRPLAGDFDGNGVDDILWYATGPAPDSVWYFQRDRSYRRSSRAAGPHHRGAPRRRLRRRRDRRHLLLRPRHGGRPALAWPRRPHLPRDRARRERLVRPGGPRRDGRRGRTRSSGTHPGATTSYRWEFLPDGSSVTSRPDHTRARRGGPRWATSTGTVSTTC